METKKNASEISQNIHSKEFYKSLFDRGTEYRIRFFLAKTGSTSLSAGLYSLMHFSPFEQLGRGANIIRGEKPLVNIQHQPAVMYH